VFIQKEENRAGIYTLRLYVRGRPIRMTIDDDFVFLKKFYQFSSDSPEYAYMSEEYPSLWGMLLEKAWSKILMNYPNSIGGFT
jgi:hypothetical protein